MTQSKNYVCQITSVTVMTKSALSFNSKVLHAKIIWSLSDLKMNHKM